MGAGSLQSPGKGGTVKRGVAWRTWCWWAALRAFPALLACAAYSNALYGDLVYDDEAAVRTNGDLDAKSTPLSHLFVHDFWGSDIFDESSHKSYRPVTVMMFRAIFGQWSLNVVPFHALNVALHALTSTLLFEIGRMMGVRAITSLLASFVFALHPVHTDAVASVVGTAESAASTFGLCALGLFLLGTRATSALFAALAHAAALVLALASALSKETGLATLGTMAIYDIVAHTALLDTVRAWIPGGAVQREKSARTKKSSALRAIVRASACILLAGAFVASRAMILGRMTPKIERLHNPYKFEEKMVRVLSFSYLHARQLLLMVWPWPLSSDYSMYSILPVKEILDPRVAVTVLAYSVVLVFLLWCGLRAPLSAAVGLLTLSALGVVTFLPLTNIFFHVSLVIAERALYTPSMTVCFAISWLVTAMVVGVSTRKRKSSKRLRRVVYACVLLTLMSYGSLTMMRNNAWRTQRQLFETAARAYPLNAKASLNFANELWREGQCPDGRTGAERPNAVVPEELERAQRVVPIRDRVAEILAETPADILSHPNLTLCNKAVKLIERAIAIYPNYTTANYNYGVMIKDLLRPREAVRHILLALEGEKEYYGGLKERHYHETFGLGLALQMAGNTSGAAEAFRLARSLFSKYGEVHSNLGVIEHMNGNLMVASQHYLDAIDAKRLSRVSASGFVNAALAVEELGGLDRAAALLVRHATYVWNRFSEQKLPQWRATARSLPSSEIFTAHDLVSSFHRALALCGRVFDRNNTVASDALRDGLPHPQTIRSLSFPDEVRETCTLFDMTALADTLLSEYPQDVAALRVRAVVDEGSGALASALARRISLLQGTGVLRAAGVTGASSPGPLLDAATDVEKLFREYRGDIFSLGRNLLHLIRQARDDSMKREWLGQAVPGTSLLGHALRRCPGPDAPSNERLACMPGIYTMAYLYEALGDAHWVEIVLRRGIELDPEDPWVWSALGRLVAQSNATESWDALRRAAELRTIALQHGNEGHRAELVAVYHSMAEIAHRVGAHVQADEAVAMAMQHNLSPSVPLLVLRSAIRRSLARCADAMQLSNEAVRVAEAALHASSASLSSPDAQRHQMAQLAAAKEEQQAVSSACADARAASAS